MDDDFVLVSQSGEEEVAVEAAPEYLDGIDQYINKLQSTLWQLNVFIHDNPELAYREHKAHDALTNFMRAQSGWKVTPSAFGMLTAWKAVYDTGKPGPVVSFNAEMGTSAPGIPHPQILTISNQTHFPI